MSISLKPLKKYYDTIRHLKFSQVLYRLYYLLSIRSGLLRYTEKVIANSVVLPSSGQFIPSIVSCSDLTFTFLNRSHTFNSEVDWDLSSYGLLWCYNLNYFDFINGETAEKSICLCLMKSYAKDLPNLVVGQAPYPTSLRIMNWVKFIIRHQINDDDLNNSLLNQCLWLARNLEFHLLGNHLLENGFALLQASAIFPCSTFAATAKDIVLSQLKEQVLSDGGHFELSPMYHQILLSRLLETIEILEGGGLHADILPDLRNWARMMSGWLQEITFSDGSIPLVNDAAIGIAPSTSRLLHYAANLGINPLPTSLGASGYRKVVAKRYELLVDIGDIGPEYIPGHAHSDTLSFVLYVDGLPVIVDTGTSTYEASDLRSYQRSTAAHNTVEIAGQEQSEMWASFRVARRAKVRDTYCSSDTISAWHDGYLPFGCRHHRSFHFSDSTIVISDTVQDSGNTVASKAFLHFHPDITVKVTENSVETEKLHVIFDNAASVTQMDYLYAPEFNVTNKATCIEIFFHGHLQTIITFR